MTARRATVMNLDRRACRDQNRRLHMCSRGHALIRIWANKTWWLACANPGCTYRIFESHPTHPKDPA